MFELGEYVVHPGQGVCKVDEIVAEPQPTYMLMPIAARHPMRISFPVASESRLRPVLTSEQAEALIASYPTIEPMTHAERSIALDEEYYRNVIRQGSCEDSLSVYKTFTQRIAQIQEGGKRPPVAYERVLKQAGERASQELAVALICTSAEILERLAACEKSE